MLGTARHIVVHTTTRRKKHLNCGRNLMPKERKWDPPPAAIHRSIPSSMDTWLYNKLSSFFFSCSYDKALFCLQGFLAGLICSFSSFAPLQCMYYTYSVFHWILPDLLYQAKATASALKCFYFRILKWNWGNPKKHIADTKSARFFSSWWTF